MDSDSLYVRVADKHKTKWGKKHFLKNSRYIFDKRQKGYNEWKYFADLIIHVSRYSTNKLISIMAELINSSNHRLRYLKIILNLNQLLIVIKTDLRRSFESATH